MAAGKRIIYQSLTEMVAPEHTALVVWDVQNGLANAIFNKVEFAKNLKAFIAAARKKNIPVIYTKITPLPRQYESAFRLYTQMRRAGVDDPEKLPLFMQPGSPESEIYPDVAPLASDTVLNKHTTSIFIGTHFESMMRNKGIETLIFTGITTEIGIDSSARDSANRSFYTIVVEDCVSSADKESHDSTLKVLKKVCVVATSKDIAKEWK